MTNKNIHSPSNYLFSKQLNLSDFNFEKPAKNFIKRHLKNHNEDLTNNQLLKFIETTFNYAKISLNTYSNYFSNHLYTQPVLFTILALKIYTKSTYREYNSIFTII